LVAGLEVAALQRCRQDGSRDPRRVRDYDNAERNDGGVQGFCFNPLDDDHLRSALSEDNIAEKAGQNLQGIS
jgi:hypothetical protein